MKNKQNWTTYFCGFLTIILCCVFLGCSFSSSGGGSSEPTPVVDQDDPYSYFNVSTMPFFGGSVLYTPSQQVTNQLSAGKKIAIRMNSLQRKKETITNQYFEAESPEEIEYSDEDPTTASYGILTITSVGSSSISFNFQQFNDNRTLTSGSNIIIEDGKSCSLVPGCVNLKYHSLSTPRNGFEGAKELEFVNIESKNYSTEYATFDYDAKRAISTSTFIGLNSNGDFIFTTKEKPSITSNARAAVGDISDLIQHGDHILYVPEDCITEPEEKEVETTTSVDDGQARIASDFYTVVAKKGENQLSLQTVEDYIIKDDDDEIPIDDFLDCFYFQGQFSSSNGAIELLKSFPTDFLWNENIDVNSITEDDAIDELNRILLNPYSGWHLIKESVLSEEERSAMFNSYVKHFKEFYKKVFSEEKEITATTTEDDIKAGEDALLKTLTDSNVDIVTKIDSTDRSEAYYWIIYFNRTLIETVYPKSPNAIADSPEFQNVFPIFSISEGDSFGSQIDGIDYAVARGATKDEADFLKNQKKLQNELAKWKKIDLVKVGLDLIFTDWSSLFKKNDSSNLFNGNNAPEKGGSKSKGGGDSVTKDNIKNILKTFNVEIKLCFKAEGYFRWKKLGGRIGTGIYINSNADLADLDFVLTLFSKKLADKDVRFSIGPIPFTVNYNAVVSLDLAGNIESGLNTSFGLCGMYGAEAWFDAKYGVKWFLKPYFTSNSGTRKINETYYYAGDNVQTPKDNFCLQLDLIPKLTVTIGMYVGPRFCFVGVDFVNTAAFDVGYALGIPAMTVDKMESGGWIQMEKSANNRATAYMRIVVGLNGKLNLVAGIKIIKKRHKMKIKSWELYNLQAAVKNGRFEGGKNIIKF